MQDERAEARAGDEDEITSRRVDAVGRRQLSSGRLGTYTILGGVTGIVPLPWVPDAIARRVRGALVHDLTARHGLSLTPEARSLLADVVGELVLVGVGDPSGVRPAAAPAPPPAAASGRAH